LVWKSSALGVIPGDGTEVRRGSIYEQGESRRGERREGNGWMSPYNSYIIIPNIIMVGPSFFASSLLASP
jgi:hypothetical protein